MRILVLHSRYLTGSASGENRVADDEVRLLREAGHDVFDWQPAVEQDRHRLGVAADAVWSRSAARAVERLSADVRPDVVHVHSLYPRLSPAVLRSVPDDVPVVMTLHNFRLMCLPATYLRNGSICEACAGRVPWRGVVHACYRGSRSASSALATSLVVHRAVRSFSRVDRFLAVSRFVREKHVEAGLDPARILVKSNFAWPAERRRGPGRHVLFLGRLTPEKGLATVLRALPSSLDLVVAGDGSERPALEAISGANVTFLGQVAPSATHELLRDARALVVPSHWYEGQPRVIVEALAVGVPVLASRIGGLPELVEDQRNGCLIGPMDEDGWRKAMEGILDDNESIRLGEGAFATWERRFTPETALSELERAYDLVGAR